MPIVDFVTLNQFITHYQVELLQWFVTEGQSIKAFDRICEVQSDKATVEISSRYDGKVRWNLTLTTEFYLTPNFRF